MTRKAEETRPEKTADFMLRMVEGSTIVAAAEDCGLSRQAARALVKRVRERYGPVMEELEEVSNDALIRLLSDKQKKIMDSIDDEVIKSAGLKDRAIAFGIMTDKRQLLSGLPTQRLSVDDRGTVDELIQKCLKEARRRGLVPGFNPDDGITNLVPVQDDTQEPIYEPEDKRVHRTSE